MCSDDAWLVGRGDKHHVDSLLYLFILVVMGAPLAWHKARGRVQSEWVGYTLDGAFCDWDLGVAGPVGDRAAGG